MFFNPGMSDVTDLQLAVETITTKRDAYTRLWDYYEGNHPLVFSSENLKQVFKNLRSVPFEENWCQVIVNAPLRRLIIDGWDVQDEGNKEALLKLWSDTRLQRRASDVHLATLVTGECFVIVQKDESGRPQAFYNDPRHMAMFYDDENPDQKVFAAKMWQMRRTKKWRLNLYYEDHVEHYQNNGADIGQYTGFQAFAEDGGNASEPHGFDAIPVVHFRRQLRTVCGELTRSVLNIQDAVNKLFSDLMVTSEYSAFKQRYAIGNFELPDGAKLPVAPFTTLKIPGAAAGDQDHQVGTFEASDPANYIAPMDRAVNSMAAISETPKHFFYVQSGDPSGESIQAMDAPLVAKVGTLQDSLGDAWAECARLLLAAADLKVGEEKLWPIWRSAAVPPSEKSKAEARQANKNAGMPLKFQLRREGATEEELDQLDADLADEATRGNVPRIAAVGQNEEIRTAAIGTAKGALAGGVEPAVAKAITQAAEGAVDRMAKDGRLAAFMEKWQGRATA